MSARCRGERNQAGEIDTGLARHAVEGRTQRTRASVANRPRFGAEACPDGVVASYRQARLLTLTVVANHLVWDAAFGVHGQNAMLCPRTRLPL